MNPRLRWIGIRGAESRTAACGLAMLLIFFVSATTAQETSAAARQINTCSRPGEGQRVIGWGKNGLFFSVPKRGVKTLGGKLDVDYVKFVIKPTNHEASLVLSFGGMAFRPEPPYEMLRNSASSTQTKLLDVRGHKIGLDSRGINRDKSRWRWLGVASEGATYEDASAEDAVLFDRIIDSACVVAYPNR